MERSKYDDKVQNFLATAGFQQLNKDPTPVFQQNVREALRKTTCIFPEKFNIQSLISMNPLAPRFYGAPKVHKINTPVRPVVSFCSSPSEKLAKYLNKAFYSLTGFQAVDSIKNTSEFIRTMSSVQLPPHCKLVSFDVKDLYTSVPKDRALAIMNRLLQKHCTDISLIQEFTALLDLCLSHNYFSFNGNIYSATEGLAMGAPLSALGANAFMHYFYKEYIDEPHNRFYQFIFKWIRYVDDVFCIWTGSSDQLAEFLDYLNNCFPSIEFTVETEENNRLNYLDLTVIRTGNNLRYEIFRKPTATDMVIHADSHHPWRHKLAAFNSMIHRLLITPLDTVAFNKEFNTIKVIANNNGYSGTMIDKMLAKKNRNLLISAMGTARDRLPRDGTWCSIPYLGSVSDRLAKLLSRYNLNVSFNMRKTLKTQLSRVKDPVHPGDKSGVYIIVCGDCDAEYVGQTGRSFRIRAKEHMQRPSSRFNQHLVEFNHEGADHKIGFLHYARKGRQLTSLENLEIAKSQLRDPVNNINERGEISVVLRAVLSTPSRISLTSIAGL